MMPSHLKKPEKPKKPNKPCWLPRKEYLQPMTLVQESIRTPPNEEHYDEEWNDVWDEEELQKKEETVWLNGTLSLNNIIEVAKSKNIPLDNVYIGSFLTDDYFHIHAFHQEKLHNDHYDYELACHEKEMQEYKRQLASYQEKKKNYDRELSDYISALEQEAREAKRELEDLA